ncbi:2OG-Fe(II) oxygenase [Kordia sp. YSTF-M3]|uniref:2OG-Fe(II) oxygenase n=1 Tax=Kordia aestuariivivens TaxID=2759037 RepID=A0ABR7Q8J2_9FLAO|nr:2OG-Fe(II) oxygenase [Kordia aestuariivivens]MBC8754813.1 2OG-Fe(II) oxygenase [Kordia aestuariivivens]
MNDAEEIKEQNQFEELIQGLIDNQYGCCNDFIIPSIITGLRNNITTLNTSGKMKSAGIGNKVDFQNDQLIRSDKVNWIEELSTNEYEKIYLKKIWRFIHHLNKTCFTSIKTFESHYANYELGSFYKRHLDQFKSEKGRKYSIVLYLNQNWEEKDAGVLSLYPLNAEQKNISPLEGRMVFFRSDEMEHEVHPSATRERNSIAGWLKN